MGKTGLRYLFYQHITGVEGKKGEIHTTHLPLLVLRELRESNLDMYMVALGMHCEGRLRGALAERAVVR